MKLRILMTILAFLAGFVASNLFAGATEFNSPILTDGFEVPNTITGLTVPVVEMPRDRVNEDQILVYRDQVILDIENAEWSTFTPTKSMVPVIDTGANAIQVKPNSQCTDIEIGDIISYESEYADGTIIHRVVEKGADSNGVYFIAKGDNNPNSDPGKIRCNQVLRVLVAIIY